ncbi:MAG: response regulator transcription factor [Oceanobacter sp.]
MKILLADDHAVVRQGYRALLAAMIAPVTIVEAASGTDAALLYMAETPDIVILDINMPDMNGIETARQILTRDPQAKILMFSMYEETTVIREALSAGALGYLSKSSPPPLMIEAVNTVMAGNTFIDDRFASVSFSSSLPIDTGLRLDQLPPREKDIAQRLIEGKSNHQIAEELGISAKTVANRATAIRQKLGVKSTAELVRKALQN